ncbi:MAG: hypothetical protein OXG83_10935 [Acidobacteria bacterium]|nr:hypothetical protein [Acidobacteriota bacterium]
MNGATGRGVAARPDCGASLIETLVAFSLTVAVSVAALFLFVLHQRLARAQLETASLLQAQQAAHVELRRSLRAAGRGGLVHQLPGQAPRPELAVDVEKQVRAGHAVGSTTAAEGTDVLVIRGVINGPLYWVDEYGFDPVARSGWVVVGAQTPYGTAQSLEMLRAAGDAGDDALLLVSGDATGVHAVVPIVDVAGSGRGRGRRLRVEFQADASRGSLAAGFLSMSSGGSWPAGYMSSVDRVGVLEEWRFYVRPQDPQSRRGPQLAMARLYPGSAVAWRHRSANLTQVVADGITDLEVTVREKGEDGGPSVTVTTTARIGEPAAAALRAERSAASVVRLRDLW